MPRSKARHHIRLRTREGLLYGDLDEITKDEDPLLSAALEIGDRLGRFGDHGAALDQWMDPLFPDDGPALKRYRLAACLLGDIAWNAHPDYRAERAADLAIHGNWVGIDANGRAVIGRALCSAFSGESGFNPELLTLLGPAKTLGSAPGDVTVSLNASAAEPRRAPQNQYRAEPGRVVLRSRPDTMSSMRIWSIGGFTCWPAPRPGRGRPLCQPQLARSTLLSPSSRTVRVRTKFHRDGAALRYPADDPCARSSTSVRQSLQMPADR
jgi:hypothetical protein